MACVIEIDGNLPRSFGLTKSELKKVAREFADLSSARVGIPFREVTIILQGDEESAEVHKGINGVDGATDVITQPYDAMPGCDDGVYGELYVNVERAMSAAPKRKGWSSKHELLLYIAHGMDHLSGADDLDEKGYQQMRRRELSWIKRIVLSLLIFCSTYLFASEEFNAEYYTEVVSQMVLPQGGGNMRHLAGAATRFGCRFTPIYSLEAEVGSLENKCAFALRNVWSMQGWEWFGKMFGYERFDPFVSAGIRGWMNDGDVGPCIGIGALYYLDDHWAVRFDGDVTLGVERDTETIHSLSLGLQYTF